MTAEARATPAPPDRFVTASAAEPAVAYAVDSSAESLVIDCERCTVRGSACGDCVVTVLLGGPPFGVPLDDEEQRAIEVLAGAGLVPQLRMVEPVESPYVEPA